MNLRTVIALPVLFLALHCSSSSKSNDANTGGLSNGTGGSAGSSNASGGAAAGGVTASGGAVDVSTTTPNGVGALLAPPVEGDVPQPSGTAGNLKVLDWAGFKAALSYTFDDANSSQIAHYADLQALGARYTFYLITGKTEASSDTWTQALADGHELGNHTRNHQQTGTAIDVDAGSTFLLQKFNVVAWTMASPYGDSSYITLAKSRYLLNRGVSNGLIGPNDATDPFNTYCYIPPTGTAASGFNAQVDSARSAGKWRIMLVHGFAGGTDGAYQPIAFEEFAASVTYAQSLGDVWIDTMANVGAYWRGQKAFTAAQPVKSGDATTWSWTLPDHFPPGRVLRVTVDGGTLSQGAAPLAWDTHGYYEVALDALTLTLSP